MNSVTRAHVTGAKNQTSSLLFNWPGWPRACSLMPHSPACFVRRPLDIVIVITTFLIHLTMVVTTARFAAAIACLIARSDAFAPSLAGRTSNSFRGPAAGRPLFAAEGGDGPKDGSMITSARKEIGYDAASGRFFETDIDPEDCIPGNEYCMIDKVSGSMVRLTMEEKERIFLDALQVSAFGDVDFTWVTAVEYLFLTTLVSIAVLLYQWTAAPQRRGFRSLERGSCLERLKNGADESSGHQVPRGSAGILEGAADPFGLRIR